MLAIISWYGGHSYGRDWMVPLLLSTSIAYGVVWRMTKKKSWAVAGVGVSLIGIYTKVVLMGECAI